MNVIMTEGFQLLSDPTEYGEGITGSGGSKECAEGGINATNAKREGMPLPKFNKASEVCHIIIDNDNGESTHIMAIDILVFIQSTTTW